MKYSKFVSLVLSVGVSASVAFAEGEATVEKTSLAEVTSAPVAYAGTAYKSGYLSYGTLVHDDWVLQSYAAVELFGFNLNVWNSRDPAESYSDGCYACETDVEFDYVNKIGDLNYKLGFATWMYAMGEGEGWSDDLICRANVGYNGWFVRPEIDAVFGIHEQQGCICRFTLSRKLDINDIFSVNVYSLVDYASKSWRKRKGADGDGFVDSEIGARLSCVICPNASISVGCQYAFIVADTLRDCVDGGSFWEADEDPDHFIWYACADLWF